MPINFPDSPSVNDQYTVGDRTWTWNGTYWQTSTSMSTFTASDSEPVDADAGDIWFDSTIGKTFVNYGGNWVEIGAAGSVVDVIADADADTKIQVEVSADSDKIEFTTAGTKRLEIDASGHIVPASNETYDLGSASARFRDIYLSGASIDLGGATISSDGTNLTMPPVSNISGDFTVGTDVLHVDHANSSVGIGTTSPAENLDVTGSTSDVSLVLRSGDVNTGANGGKQIVMGYAGSTSYAHNIRTRHNSTAQSGNAIDFYTWNQGTDVSTTYGTKHVMTLDGNGNVGIGTSTPNAQLEIANVGSGALYATGDGFYVDQNASQLDTLFLRSQGPIDISSNLDGGTSNDYVRILTANNVERMRIDALGNVGIGTASPGAPLHLYGATNAVDQIRISSTNGTTSEYGFLGADASTDVMRYGYWTGSGFGNHHFEGNVGINDSTPSHRLEVNGDVRGNQVFNQKVGPSYPSSAGWYTIATCPSGRASGLFNVHDPRSAYHAGLTFYINHLYGQETITLLNHNYYSGYGPILGIRVKGNGVYDGAAVQVYLQVSSGGAQVFLSENYGEQTWTIKDFIPDGTDPGGQSGTWSSFTQQQYLNLNGLPRGSTYTSGTVYGASKSFAIPHPTREDYILNHGAIEGPENGVYHRGRCVDGTIVLPEYWDGLVDLDTVTIQLTPIGEHSNWVSSISGREISVGGGECFYIAYGERIDIDPLVVESPMYPDVLPEIEGGP